VDVAVTGSSGLIGRALARSLADDGHRAIPIVRRAASDGEIRWDPDAGDIDAAGLEGLDAVVHLAGEGIAARPWTARQRHRIAESRRAGTDVLCTALARLSTPPAVLVSGSAIGYYGERGDDVLIESAPPGEDFLAGVCVAWEAATAPASAAGVRVAHIRTGIVLDAHGGALAKMLPAFRWGLGGRAGDGHAWMSWVSIADEVRAIRHAIEDASLRGPLNVTAPHPVRNADFTEALGAAVDRATRLTIPSALRRVPFGVGDLVDNLLFTSIRATPAALESSGFAFEHPTIDVALAAVLADGR